jgi:hypothetical protein
MLATQNTVATFVSQSETAFQEESLATETDCNAGSRVIRN